MFGSYSSSWFLSRTAVIFKDENNTLENVGNDDKGNIKIKSKKKTRKKSKLNRIKKEEEKICVLMRKSTFLLT